MAGGFVGAVATTAMAGNTLISIGDMGSFTGPALDGFSDRIFVTNTNGYTNGVQFDYMGVNGLAVTDTSGQLVEVIINKGGSGYGQNCTVTDGLTFNNNMTVTLSNGVSADAGWWARANENNTGSGGTGAQAFYRVDGPAGGLFYQPGFSGQNDFTIVNGSTGYRPGRNLNYTQAAVGAAGQTAWQNANCLVATISAAPGSNLGTDDNFGFINTGLGGSTGNAGIQAVYGAGPVDTGSVLDGIYTAAAAAKGLTLAICNDNVTNGQITPGSSRRIDQYGNYRLFLGATPNQANGTVVSWNANAAGEVANLAITQNGNAVQTGASAAANGNATSGIGYIAGNFMVYDANGDIVNGLTIAYDVDDEGRIYTGAKGAYNTGRGGGTDTTTGGPNATSITNDDNNLLGWSITKNNANLTNSAGMTLVPQGNGTGFECTDVHLFGEIIALQSMASNGSFGMTGDGPRIEWSISGAGAASGAVIPAAGSQWDYTMSAPHDGSIVVPGGGAVVAGGQSYITAPGISTNPGDTGTGGTMTGVIGSVGVRNVNINGTDLVFDAVTPEFDCFSNVDFNGDGYSDLVWDSEMYGCYIWNMGPNAEILSSGELPKPGGAWTLVGCGGMNYEGVGSCMFWYNTETGATAVWLVNTTGAVGGWIVGSATLDTVDHLTWLARCTNNPALNSGNAVYWHNTETGQFAYWPITVNNNGTTPSLATGSGYLKLGGAEILLPANAGWRLDAVANMAGRQTGASNTQRDVILSSSNGTTAIWLMDSSNLSIDTSLPGDAAGGGRGLTSYQGATTVQDEFWAGVGLYNVERTAYTVNLNGPGSGFRPQQFATMNWTPGDFTSATWKMDRNVSLINYAATPRTGNGFSAAPYTVSAATTQ